MLLHNSQTTNQNNKSSYHAALSVYICMLLSGCSGHKPDEVLDLSDSIYWREGDIVLRCGWGMESRAVVVNGRSTYSHTGLLHHDECSGWQVVHAVPGEDTPEYIKSEAVAQFFQPMRARYGAWLRVNCCDSLAAQATGYALQKVAERVLFDNNYLLDDTTEIYCTELVWRSYRSVGIDVSSGLRHEVPHLFSSEGECILPSDIEMSKTTQYVKPLKTKTL